MATIISDLCNWIVNYYNENKDNTDKLNKLVNCIRKDNDYYNNPPEEWLSGKLNYLTEVGPLGEDGYFQEDHALLDNLYELYLEETNKKNFYSDNRLTNEYEME